MASFEWPPVAGGGGGGGIESINGDTTSAQVIAGGTGISVSTVSGTTTISATGGGTIVENMDGSIPAPQNYTFYIRPYCNYAGTINSIYIGTISGSDTVAININGTAVTGLGTMSVTSTGTTFTATALNTFSVGDQITLVTSNDATATGLYWSISLTRNL